MTIWPVYSTPFSSVIVSKKGLSPLASPANHLGERDTQRFPGDEPGMPDAQDEAQPPLGHLIGRKLSRNRPSASVRIVRLAHPGRKLPRVATPGIDRTDHDRGAFHGLPGLHIDHAARERHALAGFGVVARSRDRPANGQQTGQDTPVTVTTRTQPGAGNGSPTWL